MTNGETVITGVLQKFKDLYICGESGDRPVYVTQEFLERRYLDSVNEKRGNIAKRNVDSILTSLCNDSAVTRIILCDDNGHKKDAFKLKNGCDAAPEILVVDNSSQYHICDFDKIIGRDIFYKTRNDWSGLK